MRGGEINRICKPSNWKYSIEFVLVWFVFAFLDGLIVGNQSDNRQTSFL